MKQGGAHIPATVPAAQQRTYQKNFETATRGTGRLLLFAGDQKVEHLNDDFVGFGLHPETADPEHYFRIAQRAQIGALAMHLGFIARYGADYRTVPYIVKLNGKTNLVPTKQRDPLAARWLSVEDVTRFARQSKLDIVGVGYTVYLGSEAEAQMLSEAARIVYDAHQAGLLAIIWMYPRGRAVKKEAEPHLLAGAAGVGLALGADFVKVNYPYTFQPPKAAKKFREATVAAGRTGVLAVGGGHKSPRHFLRHIYEQINTAGTRGVAVGRNIYQRPLDEAVRLADAISGIVNAGMSADDAYGVYMGEKKLQGKRKK